MWRGYDSKGQVLVGTCGWADPALIKAGTFYPANAKTAGARLAYYASQFPVVEVDSSYYAVPAPHVTKGWVEGTLGGFAFDIKAFRLFTHHPTPVKALPPDMRHEVEKSAGGRPTVYAKDVSPGMLDELWARFREALLPLVSAGKLGAVVFQFPSWFGPARRNKEYVAGLRQRLPRFAKAVEFRSGAWFDGGTAEQTVVLLRDAGLALVCVDEPQGFRSSVPPMAEVTADIALVRFHGRNRETWEKSGLTPAERFDYLYREEELREWLPRIGVLAERARQVHVLFNNCYGDKAVVNAGQMRLLLGCVASPGHARQPDQERLLPGHGPDRGGGILGLQ